MTSEQIGAAAVLDVVAAAVSGSVVEPLELFVGSAVVELLQ